MPPARSLTASQRDWLRVRSYLQEHRYSLAGDAAGDYPADRRVAGTPLLAAPGWQPAEPVPLAAVGLELTSAEFTPSAAAAPAVSPAPSDALDGAATPLLPERPDGTRYHRYSDVLRDLAAPAVFENRVTYRLTEAVLISGLISGLTPGASRLAFTRGRYFDGVDTGEAAAHEYAATRLGGRPAGLRALIANPCDLRRRPDRVVTSEPVQAAGAAVLRLAWRHRETLTG
jgi:hypothetical protein